MLAESPRSARLYLPIQAIQKEGDQRVSAAARKELYRTTYTSFSGIAPRSRSPMCQKLWTAGRARQGCIDPLRNKSQELPGDQRASFMAQDQGSAAAAMKSSRTLYKAKILELYLHEILSRHRRLWRAAVHFFIRQVGA